MYRINETEKIKRALKEKGYISYPSDFERLKNGQDFTCWRSGGDLIVETTLHSGVEIENKIKQFLQKGR